MNVNTAKNHIGSIVLTFISLIILSTGTVVAQTPATLPYSTGFESGVLDPAWSTTSSLTTGRIQCFTAITTSCVPHTGNYFLGMDHNSSAGTYNLNEAKLHLDLSSVSGGVVLQFWWAEWNDETEPQDGVWISDNNGTTYYKVIDLPGANYTDLQWYFFKIDMDSAVASLNLNYNSNFIIKFQQYDNYYFNGGNDGHMYDDILITGNQISMNNAGVTDIISPVDDCEGITQNVEAVVKNLGSNQINNVEVHWKLNNVAQTTFNYSGLLDTANGTGPDSAIVTLGSVSLTAGVTEEIVAWTEMPNNLVDSVKRDDTTAVSVKGFDFPTVSMIVIPRNTLCFGFPYEFRATPSTQGSVLYQWKVNTVNSGPTTTNNKFGPSLVSGDSVNVELQTEYCDTASYTASSNYITMHFNPEPKLISGSAETDTVLENTSSNYLIPVVSGSIFTWSAVGGTIASPVGNAVTVEWGSAMDTAKIMVEEKDAGNCKYTNVRNVVIISIVGIKDENNLIGIGYAYPNPANTRVTIPVVVDGNWDIDLNLYDITGKKVKTIFHGAVSGNRDFAFNVADLQNGIYFYKVTTGDGFESVKKLSIKH